MSRYIDMDAIQEFLENEIKQTQFDMENSCGDEYYEMAAGARECALREMLSELNRKPTADVQEVRHGKWIRTVPTTPASYRRVCSLCGQIAIMIREEYKYCPNCGAKMDLEDKNG